MFNLLFFSETKNEKCFGCCLKNADFLMKQMAPYDPWTRPQAGGVAGFNPRLTLNRHREKWWEGTLGMGAP